MIKTTIWRQVVIAALLAGGSFTVAANPPPPPPVSYGVEEDVFHPVRARQGMVASVDALATRVGVDILRQGGNAVDAAVAVAQIRAGRAVQGAQHTLAAFLFEPCVGIVGQQIGAFLSHTVIVGGGDAQMSANLPMGNARDGHGLDQLGAAVIRQVQKHFFAVGFHPQAVGGNEVVLFGLALPLHFGQHLL